LTNLPWFNIIYLVALDKLQIGETYFKKNMAKGKKNKKTKALKVKLTKEFKSGDKVLYTNYGRFKILKDGKVNLVFGEGENEKKIKANYA